ncbi:hypothetical protein DFH09DRAFT_1312304 [Mycena vulgaris]|nr:hypothetical protein DFH09DRAFT_1312304 [Mycena vulgaris]
MEAHSPSSPLVRFILPTRRTSSQARPPKHLQTPLLPSCSPIPHWMPHLFSRVQSVTHCNPSKACSSNSAAPSNAGTLERLEDLGALASADREKTGFSALLQFRKALHDCHP